ncbi:MAG: sigma-70 family RNA polymerase sigma factor [Alphaproteobacteria bacterium]|nr:sigma-70 family RNA polymerase sigma factor [Alphaproteobacteria bacterium]
MKLRADRENMALTPKIYDFLAEEDASRGVIDFDSLAQKAEADVSLLADEDSVAETSDHEGYEAVRRNGSVKAPFAPEHPRSSIEAQIFFEMAKAEVLAASDQKELVRSIIASRKAMITAILCVPAYIKVLGQIYDPRSAYKLSDGQFGPLGEKVDEGGESVERHAARAIIAQACDQLYKAYTTNNDEQTTQHMRFELEEKINRMAPREEALPKFIAAVASLDTLGQDKAVQAVHSHYHDYKEGLETLVMTNQRAVISLSNRYLSTGISKYDLVQEGLIGLRRGIVRFDPDMGNNMSTYTQYWIKQAIRHAISRKWLLMKLPSKEINSYLQIRKIVRELESSSAEGQSVAYQEALKEIGLDARQALALGNAIKPVSLSLPVGEDGNGSTLLDLLEDHNAVKVEEEAHQNILSQDVAGVLDKLGAKNERDACIVALRFGIQHDLYNPEGSELTLQNIGDMYSISRERIRQVEKNVLKRVRKILSMKGYKPTDIDFREQPTLSAAQVGKRRLEAQKAAPKLG